MSFEKLLKDTCIIEERTRVQSGLGEVTFTWATKAASVLTRRDKNTKERIIDGDYQVTLEDFIFFFLGSVEITKEDRIVFNSENYQVLVAEKDSSNHHWEVVARRISHE